jgi:hypothetical protein
MTVENQAPTPARDASRPLNLDTIGRLGQLAFQYAALLTAGNSDPVIRHDLRRDGVDIEGMRGEFMDRLVEAWSGRPDVRAEFYRCLRALSQAAPEWAEGDGRDI